MCDDYNSADDGSTERDYRFHTLMDGTNAVRWILCDLDEGLLPWSRSVKNSFVNCRYVNIGGDEINASAKGP